MVREGLYEEIINQKLKKQLAHLDLSAYEIGKEAIDAEEAKKMLASYISNVTRKALSFIRDDVPDDKVALFEQVDACNDIIHVLSQKLNNDEFAALKIAEEAEVLTSIYSRFNSVRGVKKDKVIRPITPLSQSSLFTGSKYEPNMLSEIKREIISSDSIDLLISFIKWSGLRCILEELIEFTENKDGKLRVITTSYMEATDYKAILELSRLKNTEVKISFDSERTRLHAKAYLFKRETGFTTAYVGSSNLSNPALTAGLEWNVKVTEKDSFDIIRKIEATFESYWNDSEFITFNRENQKDNERLKMALSKKTKDDTDYYFNFDIQPYHYQKEILEQLQVERQVYGRMKNLLVAATGVGKTVISAFDYKRFLNEHRNANKFLFVAHREEILKQSLHTFRAILKDFNFGDLMVGKHTPQSINQLFISIQGFNSQKLYEKPQATSMTSSS